MTVPQQQLPTWPEMVANALNNLDQARNAASAARDELNSDWRPRGTLLSNEAADARSAVLGLVEQIKDLVDEAKIHLLNARPR